MMREDTKETLIFTLLLPRGLEVLDRRPDDNVIRAAVYQIFQRAERLGQSTHSLAMRQDSRSQFDGANGAIEHALLCLTFLQYKLDLMRSNSGTYFSSDVPRNEEQKQRLTQEIQKLLAKLDQEHSGILKQIAMRNINRRICGITGDQPSC